LFSAHLSATVKVGESEFTVISRQPSWFLLRLNVSAKITANSYLLIQVLPAA